MNYYHLTSAQQEWKERAAEIAEREIGPRAADYDRKAQFPEESLKALGDVGLWGLRVSEEHCGLGCDMVTTCLIVEEISKKCPLRCRQKLRCMRYIKKEYALCFSFLFKS